MHYTRIYTDAGGETHFERMLDIHLVVPFRVVRAAAPYLREPAKAERERGEEVFRKIVNVSSTSGMLGNAGQANYAAGKAGVVGSTARPCSSGSQSSCGEWPPA